MAKKTDKTKTDAIPGTQDRQAVVEETREEEGSGEQGAGSSEEEGAPSEETPAPSATSAPPGAAAKSAPASIAEVDYRGQRRFRCLVPIVEEGLAYSPNQTIRLTAQRARQMGAPLLALIDGEDYTDTPAPAPGKPAAGKPAKAGKTPS